jgi:5-formyltetrahydrofolate cyclo-ligase
LSAGSGSVADRKQELRRKILEARRALAPQHVAEAGRAIAELVVALPEFARASRLGLYAALPDEVPTRDLFEAARAAGKTRLLPRLLGDEIELAAVEHWEDLRRGRYGVLEPPAWAAAATPGTGELLLIPGVAFDSGGFRLGRGGGHYDRLLGRLRGPSCFGLAFELQIVDRVPRQPHDRPVQGVVTERMVRRVPAAGLR